MLYCLGLISSKKSSLTLGAVVTLVEHDGLILSYHLMALRCCDQFHFMHGLHCNKYWVPEQLGFNIYVMHCNMMHRYVFKSKTRFRNNVQMQILLGYVNT